MRHLFRFLLNERIRKDDPAAILSGPKRGRGLPKVLSISDVDRLLVHAKTLTAAPEASALQRLRALRLYCLLEVLYATGLRVSELVSLPLSASRRDISMIVVRGKGDKERLVPLNEPSRQAMADYLAAIEARIAPIDIVLRVGVMALICNACRVGRYVSRVTSSPSDR